jgi:hypothetical protein
LGVPPVNVNVLNLGLKWKLNTIIIGCMHAFLCSYTSHKRHAWKTETVLRMFTLVVYLWHS